MSGARNSIRLKAAMDYVQKVGGVYQFSCPEGYLSETDGCHFTALSETKLGAAMKGIKHMEARPYP